MKKQLYLILLTSLTLILIIAFGIYDLAFESKIVASQGIATYSHSTLNDYYSLDGEWEVYENQLIATDRIDISSIEKTYTTLPFSRFLYDNEYGYISYRLVIQDFPKGENIIVGFDDHVEGYAIYLNGVLTMTNSHLKNESGLLTLVAEQPDYINDQDDLEIIIEISNYLYGYTGLTRSPHLSGQERFYRSALLNFAFKAFIVGAIFFAALYQFFVLGIRKKEKGAFCFAALSIFFALRLVFYHFPYFFFLQAISHHTGRWGFFIHHITLYLAVFALYCLLKNFYEKQKQTELDQIIFYPTLSIILLSLILPFDILSSYSPIFYLLAIIIMGLIFLYTLIQKQKNEVNPFVSIMVLLLLLSLTYDLLIKQNVILYAEEMTTGVYLFVALIYSSVYAFVREDEMSKVEEIVSLNKKIRDTEFTFLNSQIQSHFIYNTLNSIQSLCFTNPVKAGELIEDFSSYLRTRLEFNKMPNLLNVEDELENIRTYLNIEQERFGKRIRVEYNLLVGDFLIPPLTVQPLVENSVKHGISMKKTGGLITISTYDDPNFIYIKVADDGVGFDLKSLSEKQRVGTQNIRDRLRLHLNAELFINSEVGIGTVSVIQIPKKK
ncbi:MAG: histidine kinase [Bacilli bacterium]|nr:histidine kinase [Bacilli bacterium]